MTIPKGYTPNHKIWDKMGRITPCGPTYTPPKLRISPEDYEEFECCAVWDASPVTKITFPSLGALTAFDTSEGGYPEQTELVPIVPNYEDDYFFGDRPDEHAGQVYNEYTGEWVWL